MFKKIHERGTRFFVIACGLFFFGILRLFILRYIPIRGLYLGSPFLADLLGKGFLIPLWLIILSDVLNLVLLLIVGEKILGKNYGFLAPVFYAISPWPAYLSLSGSIYIFILFGVLLFYLGLTLIKEDQNFLGTAFILLGLGITVYSNSSMLFVLPFLLWGAYKSGQFTKKKSKAIITLLPLVLLPIIFFSALHQDSLRQIAAKDISLFDEVGLINSVNAFRGEVSSAGYPILGKLIENKITYLGRHVIFNTLTTFAPYTYFTQQFKLLGFSFTPPIFLGLLIPFLYAITLMFKIKVEKRYLFLLTLPLLAPTILRTYSPDLNSLVLILPTILFISSWGTEELIKNRKRLFVVIVIVLIFLQGSTTLFDISTREPIRYQNSVQPER